MTSHIPVREEESQRRIHSTAEGNMRSTDLSADSHLRATRKLSQACPRLPRYSMLNDSVRD